MVMKNRVFFICGYGRNRGYPVAGSDPDQVIRWLCPNSSGMMIYLHQVISTYTHSDPGDTFDV